MKIDSRVCVRLDGETIHRRATQSWIDDLRVLESMLERTKKRPHYGLNPLRNFYLWFDRRERLRSVEQRIERLKEEA